MSSIQVPTPRTMAISEPNKKTAGPPLHASALDLTRVVTRHTRCPLGLDYKSYDTEETPLLPIRLGLQPPQANHILNPRQNRRPDNAWDENIRT